LWVLGVGDIIPPSAQIRDNMKSGGPISVFPNTQDLTPNTHV
jgi:hypothetical protein